MPPVGFEPMISAGERPQTYALDRAATETGMYVRVYVCIYVCMYVWTDGCVCVYYGNVNVNVW